MTGLHYKPEAAKKWVATITNYFVGEGDSIKVCGDEIAKLMGEVVQPGVWSGPAALANYKNLIEVHKALVQFCNRFCEEFTTTIQNLNASIKSLESANLGSDFGTLDSFSVPQFNKVQNAEEVSIDTTTIDYSQDVMERIVAELKSVRNKVDSTTKMITAEINKIGDSDEIWGGDSANEARPVLEKIVTDNMNELSRLFEVCFNNIDAAAQNSK